LHNLVIDGQEQASCETAEHNQYYWYL